MKSLYKIVDDLLLKLCFKLCRRYKLTIVQWCPRIPPVFENDTKIFVKVPEKRLKTGSMFPDAREPAVKFSEVGDSVLVNNPLGKTFILK